MQLITATELAKRLSVPKVTVYSWVRRGVLPYVQIERAIRFDEAEIEEWVKTRRRPAGGRTCDVDLNR